LQLFLILLIPVCTQAADTFDQEASRLCQTYVGVRTGNLLAVSVEAVTRLPKRQQWLVTGRARQDQAPLYFICRLSQPAGRWRLEQLELLQLRQSAQN